MNSPELTQGHDLETASLRAFGFIFGRQLEIGARRSRQWIVRHRLMTVQHVVHPGADAMRKPGAEYVLPLEVYQRLCLSL